MSQVVKPQVIDGRRARSERSKQAIIEASLALMDEGRLIPTAQQIADKAGVAIRSFFRHFEDMETLFATIDEQIRDAMEVLFFGGDGHGTLEERILQAVERYGVGYEKHRNLILSTSAQLWRSETLRSNYARYQRGLRKDLTTWLPELKRLSGPEQEAVCAIASFEMWHRLRYHQGLSQEKTIGVLAGLLQSLLKSDT